MTLRNLTMARRGFGGTKPLIVSGRVLDRRISRSGLPHLRNCTFASSRQTTRESSLARHFVRGQDVDAGHRMARRFAEHGCRRTHRFRLSKIVPPFWSGEELLLRKGDGYSPRLETRLWKSERQIDFLIASAKSSVPFNCPKRPTRRCSSVL